MTSSFSNSKIYSGSIHHRRMSPRKHSFSYSLYMLALDVSELEASSKEIGLFGFSWFHPIRFVEKDYLSGEPNKLSQRIKDKVSSLNGHADINKIIMLVQARCFGFYFSPVNFYFCYDQHNVCTQMLAEVSNTPWNERHCYLVDLLDKGEKTNKKTFQVSPFMDLNMSYFWHVKPPSDSSEKLTVTIENKQTNPSNGKVTKLFDASLVMKKKEMTQKNLLRIWCQLPVMTLKILSSIYWQALKLLVKRIPFIGYQTISYEIRVPGVSHGKSRTDKNTSFE